MFKINSSILIHIHSSLIKGEINNIEKLFFSHMPLSCRFEELFLKNKQTKQATTKKNQNSKNYNTIPMWNKCLSPWSKKQ